MKDQGGSTVERLRPLVGRGGWDYCVAWEVSQNQRFLELKACCCGGAENDDALLNGGHERLSQLGFPNSTSEACRDAMFPQHRRTAACDALADLPPCIPLDFSSSTVIHAQALMSGLPTWMYPDSNGATRATKVLVPVPCGLVELFVQDNVPEDQEITDFVVSQFIGSDADADFAVDFQPLQGGLDGVIGAPSDSHTWAASPVPSCDHPSFPWDLHAEQHHLCASPLNLFEGPRADDDGFFEGSAGSIHGMIAHQVSDMRTTAAVEHASVAESTVTRELGGGGAGAGDEKESVKEEGEGRADSGLEGSDPGDDDEEQKEGRSGRRQSCKNLMAERRRRKKLNDRLYTLRSLVPKISKMDRASILGDAIEFVKELQSQVKKLQEQLEETNPEDDGAKQADADDSRPNNVDGKIGRKRSLGQLDKPQQTGNISPDVEISASPKGANTSKPTRKSPADEEKGNQMEPQVEVSQVGANKFFLKVFCEHKRGGFVRLLEAMTSLGLDVINVTVTTSKPLVLNVFEVEKRDCEVVPPEQVRSSLLRLAMDSDDGGCRPADLAVDIENVRWIR